MVKQLITIVALIATTAAAIASSPIGDGPVLRAHVDQQRKEPAGRDVRTLLDMALPANEYREMWEKSHELTGVRWKPSNRLPISWTTGRTASTPIPNVRR